MVFQLTNELLFPDPSLAEEDGLLAIGGDLSTKRLLLAYNNGIFPWFSNNEPICWYSPHERCVIFPEKLVVSSSMKKTISKDLFEIKMNTAFEAVITNCKQIKRKEQDSTWITDEMLQAYRMLHKMGIAHSIEAWQGNILAGGMYGLNINKVFCGESMFSKVSNSSKAVLIWLCQSGLCRLLDCQVPNDHLMSLGATMISRTKYMELLTRDNQQFNYDGN